MVRSMARAHHRREGPPPSRLIGLLRGVGADPPTFGKAQRRIPCPRFSLPPRRIRIPGIDAKGIEHPRQATRSIPLSRHRASLRLCQGTIINIAERRKPLDQGLSRILGLPLLLA